MTVNLSLFEKMERYLFTTVPFEGGRFKSRVCFNILHTIEPYQGVGAAAGVIEDKTFPKVTSPVAGGRQELLRIEEFQGKIEAAMQQVFAQIINDGGIQNVDKEIVLVSEIFRLQKMDEVKANEKRFLR